MSGKQGSQHRSSNEGKACDAAVRVLEQRTDATRADIRRPEKDRVGPPADLRLQLGTQEYAIEHTQIEAFKRQIATGVSLMQLIDPVKQALCGELPGPPIYEMIFPIDPSLDVTETGLEQLQKNLIKWVCKNAQLLHGQDSITAKPPGFPYEITLQCIALSPSSGRKPGMLGAKRRAPDDIEVLRSKRLKQALRKKCPKLQDCKEEGARTVLVLESDDIALTEDSGVGKALAGLQEELADELQFPDEIYFIETDLEQGPWLVWPMKYDDKFRPVEDWTGWTHTEFCVDTLIDLTTEGA